MPPSEDDYARAREDGRRELEGGQVDASSALMTPRELCRYHTARLRAYSQVMDLWRLAAPADMPKGCMIFEAALHALEAQANEAQRHASLAWRKQIQDEQDAQAEAASRIVPERKDGTICEHAVRWVAVHGREHMWERPICYHDEFHGVRDVCEREAKGRP